MRVFAMTARVVLAGISHETNSFSSVPTDRAAFEASALVEGEALRTAFAGTNTEIGGMIEGARRAGFCLVPGLFAWALPSRPMSRALFDGLLDRIARLARDSAPVDGALVVLHGAMVVDGVPDADAAVVGAIRGAIGADRPVVATFDLHANLSPALVAACDMLIGYRTNPHVDMAERGAEAVARLADLLTGRRWQRAFRKLPLVSVSQTQVSADEPMRSIMRERDETVAALGLAGASVAVGYPYADVPQLGMAVLAYANDADVAAAGADRIAQAIWSRRDDFVPEVMPVDVAIAAATARAASRPGPVILVDVADNIGGGTPGDGTVALAGLLAAGAREAAVVLWDPEAAERACALGAGARFVGAVGARTDRFHGDPVAIDGTVVFAGRVHYRRSGPWMTGQLAQLGRVARIDVDGIHVVVTETRILPYDTQHLEAVGLDPRRLRFIVVKAAAGWRTPFEPLMSTCFYLDTPGAHAPDLSRFPFRSRPRPLYPLERDATWDGAGASP
ncbi:MAG: M81 family metallopeptidase [Alphaproteobacteria bacterium]|nr:M81 family metallopeptidase [Alphaproteobacteria bacterium]